MRIDKQDIKDMITIYDIEYLMTSRFGAEVDKSLSNDNQLVMTTVCHHEKEKKFKLYYYDNNKIFNCYNNCGERDLFGFFEHMLNMNFSQVLYYLANYLGLSTKKVEMDNEEQSEVFGEIAELQKLIERHAIREATEDEIELKEYDDVVLECFTDTYLSNFTNDNISKEVQKRFGIKYYFYIDKIIIPHRDYRGRLVGIRGRALREEDIAKGKYKPIFLNRKQWYKHHLGFNLYGVWENLEAIKRIKKVVLVEGEKGVMQYATYYGEDSIALATCGSSLSNFQTKMLLHLGVEEVTFAFDKQYKVKGGEEYKSWARKMKKNIAKVDRYFDTYVIWDTKNLLKYKDSPLDKGKEVYEKLFKKRIKCEPLVEE